LFIKNIPEKNVEEEEEQRHTTAVISDTLVDALDINKIKQLFIAYTPMNIGVAYLDIWLS